ncbi:MAG: GxxExxY protein [Acidobacteria bacterium]|nr:GxxExxY protein [Acidobacteriota bacterium]
MEREEKALWESKELIDCDEDLIDRVLTAATNVHRHLGPGLNESVYEAALMMELAAMGISAKRQVKVPVWYRGQKLDLAFQADIIVEDCLLLELKAVDSISSVHLAQTMNYQKLLNLKRGYLLNFNVKLLKEGIKRVSI